MAKQRILSAFPFGVYVNEVDAKDRIEPGVYVNETSAAASAAAPFIPYPFRALDGATARPFDAGSTSLALKAAVGVAPPFNAQDWPNPRPPAQIVFRVVHATTALTQTVVTAAPFNQADWANPQSLARRGQDAPSGRSLALYSLAAVVRPFGPSEWPNPARPVRFAYQRVVRNLALLSAPVANPFRPADLPNPPPARPFLHHAQSSWIFLVPAPVVGTPGQSASFTVGFVGKDADDPQESMDLQVNAAIDLLSVDGSNALQAVAAVGWAGKTASRGV